MYSYVVNYNMRCQKCCYWGNTYIWICAPTEKLGKFTDFSKAHKTMSMASYMTYTNYPLTCQESCLNAFVSMEKKNYKCSAKIISCWTNILRLPWCLPPISNIKWQYNKVLLQTPPTLHVEAFRNSIFQCTSLDSIHFIGRSNFIALKFLKTTEAWNTVNPWM